MRAALLTLLSTSLLIAQAQATFYAAYEDALEAMGKGRWREASLALTRATHLRPQAAAQARTYGTNFLPDYFPYLQLARCHLELGEPEVARKCLELSRRHNEPEALRTPLERRLAALNAPGQPPAPAPVPKVNPSREPSTPPAQTPPPPPEAQPDSAPLSEPATKPAEAPLRREVPQAPRDTEVAATTHLPETPALPPERPAAVPPPATPTSRPSPLALSLGAAGLVLALGLLFLRRSKRDDPDVEPGGPPLPERIGPYRILKRLGRGGFATTYLAQAEGRTPVALKVPHPHLLDEPEAMERFHQEALLGAKLNHPNLMRILDPGPAGPRSWLAFEFVDAPSLAQVLEAEGALSPRRALEIALPVAEAMAHAHAHGVVHRDLKPENILVADPIRVMDFGIARIMDAHTLTSTYAFLGTPTHAAPEAQLKTAVGPAADRYSLGILLFEMLTGQPPYDGETPFEVLEHHRRSPLPDLGLICPGIPDDLQRLIKRLTRKEPDERPEDAELLLRLREILAGLPEP